MEMCEEEEEEDLKEVRKEEEEDLPAKEDDLTVVSKEEEDPPAGEESVEQQRNKTAERFLVDVLIDISEENLYEDQEPHEYHLYSSWEDSVCGWARVAPLSGILVTVRKCSKPKNKKANDPTLLPADPIHCDTGSPASEPHVNVHRLIKSSPLNQQKESWGQTDTSVLQMEAPEWTHIDTVQRNIAHLLTGEKEEFPFQPTHQSSSHCSLLDHRSTKHQKHSHRPSGTMVPIINFTFLPPIKSPPLSGNVCRGKAPEGETFEENCLAFHKKNGRRRTGMDLHAYSTGMNSRYQRSHFFSPLPVSVPKRFHGPESSKPEDVHHTSCSVGKSISTLIAQPHMRPRCLFS
ncbi:unnamed protein product [Ophioblennius macclurei]